MHWRAHDRKHSEKIVFRSLGGFFGLIWFGLAWFGLAWFSFIWLNQTIGRTRPVVQYAVQNLNPVRFDTSEFLELPAQDGNVVHSALVHSASDLREMEAGGSDSCTAGQEKRGAQHII